MYKNKIAIFCKTCVRDIKNFEQLLVSIKKYNKDEIPLCISVARAEVGVYQTLFDKHSMSVEIFIDEELTDVKFTRETRWLTQQIVKLNIYKTNFAEHYLLIDSDCYFIKDFYVKDFLCGDVPYIPIMSEGLWGVYSPPAKNKIEETDFVTVIKQFFEMECKSVYIAMPFVITSSYLDMLEKYLQERGYDFSKMLEKCPFEMQWYKNFVLKMNLPSIECSSFFVPITLETEYLILRLLGFDENIFKNTFLGIVMNKGHVKSLKFKPSLLGKFVVKPLLKLHHQLTKGRNDIESDVQNTFLESIFSIKELERNGVKRKAITILGIKMKVKV